MYINGALVGMGASVLDKDYQANLDKIVTVEMRILEHFRLYFSTPFEKKE